MQPEKEEPPPKPEPEEEEEEEEEVELILCEDGTEAEECPEDEEEGEDDDGDDGIDDGDDSGDGDGDHGDDGVGPIAPSPFGSSLRSPLYIPEEELSHLRSTYSPSSQASQGASRDPNSRLVGRNPLPKQPTYSRRGGRGGHEFRR